MGVNPWDVGCGGIADIYTLIQYGVVWIICDVELWLQLAIKIHCVQKMNRNRSVKYE